MLTKKMDDSHTLQEHIVLPMNMNSSQTLFGGQLMAWIDEVAGICARRHCERDVRTASVSRLDFLDSAQADDVIRLEGRVIYTGNTSMVVQVNTWVEHTKAGGRLKKVNMAMLTMVAVDEHGHPIPVPPLVPQNEQERELYCLGKTCKEAYIRQRG